MKVLSTKLIHIKPTLWLPVKVLQTLILRIYLFFLSQGPRDIHLKYISVFDIYYAVHLYLFKNYDSRLAPPLLGNEFQFMKKTKQIQMCDAISTPFQSHSQTKWVNLKIHNRAWCWSLLFILRLWFSPWSLLTRDCAKILIHSWQKRNIVTVSHATISDFISRTRIPSNYLCFPLPLFQCWVANNGEFCAISRTETDYSLLPNNIEVGEERVC